MVELCPLRKSEVGPRPGGRLPRAAKAVLLRCLLGFMLGGLPWPAVADFREASRRSPNWADPLKGWGDVQLARGDARGAVRQYEAAQQRAPHWTAVREALDRARGAPA